MPGRERGGGPYLAGLLQDGPMLRVGAPVVENLGVAAWNRAHVPSGWRCVRLRMWVRVGVGGCRCVHACMHACVRTLVYVWAFMCVRARVCSADSGLHVKGDFRPEFERSRTLAPRRTGDVLEYRLLAWSTCACVCT